MSVPLLMTKLFIPSPGKYLVGRARLVEKLDQCLEPGCRLTLISAPAGFGKTSLIAAWITAGKNASTARKVAWLSLDEGDNDPVIFWSYVIAALQTQQAGVGQRQPFGQRPGQDFRSQPARAAAKPKQSPAIRC